MSSPCQLEPMKARFLADGRRGCVSGLLLFRAVALLNETDGALKSRLGIDYPMRERQERAAFVFL